MFFNFVSQDLLNVCEQLRSSFNSPSLDNKADVSFGCDAFSLPYSMPKRR
jgi:hypothetical protein